MRKLFSFYAQKFAKKYFRFCANCAKNIAISWKPTQTEEFPLAKLLRNFCGTKRKIFFSFRISFARKNSNLRNHSQKLFHAKLPYSAFLQLEFCAIPLFRNKILNLALGFFSNLATQKSGQF